MLFIYQRFGVLKSLTYFPGVQNWIFVAFLHLHSQHKVLYDFCTVKYSLSAELEERKEQMFALMVAIMSS